MRRASGLWCASGAPAVCGGGHSRCVVLHPRWAGLATVRLAKRVAPTPPRPSKLLRHELSITGAAARVGAATREESGALKPEAAERSESIGAIWCVLRFREGVATSTRRANNFRPSRRCHEPWRRHPGAHPVAARLHPRLAGRAGADRRAADRRRRGRLAAAGGLVAAAPRARHVGVAGGGAQRQLHAGAEPRHRRRRHPGADPDGAGHRDCADGRGAPLARAVALRDARRAARLLAGAAQEAVPAARAALPPRRGRAQRRRRRRGGRALHRAADCVRGSRAISAQFGAQFGAQFFSDATTPRRC